MSIKKENLEPAPLVDYRGLLISLKPSRRKTIKKTKVVMEGNLTINTVKEFLDKVSVVFTDYDYVDFYMQNVEAFDLSFVQAFYHLKEFQKKSDKVITVDSQLSDDLKKIITQSGFEKLIFKTKNV